MHVRILGPLEILHNDRAVILRGRRERTLLVLLVVSANRVVPSERLVEELWADNPPAGAPEALRVQISRLRGRLREVAADEALVTRPPGYLLSLDAEALDAARFERLFVAGRSQLQRGDAEQARVTLRAALGLWRGPALAELSDAPFAKAEAARLEELRLAALEDRIEADLLCGFDRDVVAELNTVLRLHPLRERLWAQRMRALYRMGRQAEALRAYQDLRVVLRDQLGVEPTNDLRQLERAILSHDPALSEQAPDRSGRAGPTQATLPETRGSSPGDPFVGRARELHRLQAGWAEVVAGARRVVFVSGEPGVGKTRLAAEAAGGAAGEGALVLFGRCDEGLEVPYQPFVEALAAFVSQADPALLGRLGRHRAELTRLVPAVSDADSEPVAETMDVQTARYRLFNAVAAWLAVASADRPIVLVLDDLQWAALPTLFLLRHIVRSQEPMRVLIVGTYRDTELAPDLSAFLAEVCHRPGVERLALGGLDQAAVAAFVAAGFGAGLEADSELVRTIHTDSNGNPFFAGEVVRLLRDTGSVTPRDNRWQATRPLDALGIPEGVRDVVLRRVSRLSEDANRLLVLAAVTGDQIELRTVEAAAGRDAERMLDGLDEVVRAGLVVEVPERLGTYRFVHALVRSTIYGQLSTPRRRRLHRRLGEALEGLGAEGPARLAALARHFTAAAEQPGNAKAIKYTIAAAEAATAALAHEQAAGLYERGVELLGAEHGRRRVELLLAAGEARRRAGEAGEARRAFVEAFSAAQGLETADLLGRAALGVGATVPAVGIDDQLVSMLDTALLTIGDRHLPLAAAVLARRAQAVYYSAPPSERFELSHRAVDMARPSGDAATLAAVLRARQVAVWGPDDLETRLAAATELVALGQQLCDPELELEGHAWCVVHRLELGDVAEMRLAIDQHRRLAAQLNQPLHQRDQAAWETMTAILEGQFAVAERRLDGPDAAGEAADDPAGTIQACQRWWLAGERGRPADLALACRGVNVVLSRQATAHPAWLAARAAYAGRLGHTAEARSVFEALAANGFEDLRRDAVWLNTLTFLAEAAGLLHDKPRAATLYSLMAPYSPRIVPIDRAFICKGSVAHYLGILARTTGRFHDAARHLNQARHDHQRLGSRPLVLRTMYEQAVTLAASGDPAARRKVCKLADLVATEAENLGMHGLSAQATALRGP